MEEGEELDFQNDRSLRLWLEQVDHIKVKERNGDAVYFSEAPEQLHLVKMIRRQKTNTKIFTNSKRSSNFSHPRNRQSSVTPKTSLKSLAFRRQQFNSTAKVASPPMGDKSSKMFGTSNPMFLHSSLLQTPNRPCPIPPECDVHATNKKFRSCFFGRADERDGNINHDLSCSSENLSNHSEDLNDQVSPFYPFIPALTSPTAPGGSARARVLQMHPRRRQLLPQPRRDGPGLPDGEARPDPAKRVLRVGTNHRGSDAEHRQHEPESDHPRERRERRLGVRQGAGGDDL